VLTKKWYQLNIVVTLLRRNFYADLFADNN